jgi:uncharacterized membrane protein YhaH (DUF805 family)
MEVMFEPEKGGTDDVKKALCPLKRVKLSHTLPLMLFVMINMCLVVLTLLVTGLVRVFGRISDLEKKHSIGSQRANMNSLSQCRILALLVFIATASYGFLSSSIRIIIITGFFALLVAFLLLSQEDSPATKEKKTKAISPEHDAT